MPAWDGERLMALFRRRLLDRLLARKAISQPLVSKLLCWRHPGFSSFLAEPIPFEDKRTLEDVACYLVRSPLSLKKLVYLDGQKAVLYRSRMNPSLGRNFEAMDPLEWLARMADHIPDPGKHRVHFYGHYASRVRGARAARAEPPTEIEDGSSTTTNESGKRRRCPPSWARLIHRVYQADPLVCRRCGGKLKITGYLCDSFAIRRMLEALGLALREDKPPPVPTPPREVVRVPVDEEGREFTPRSSP
jgi:Putative transposase